MTAADAVTPRLNTSANDKRHCRKTGPGHSQSCNPRGLTPHACGEMIMSRVRSWEITARHEHTTYETLCDYRTCGKRESAVVEQVDKHAQAARATTIEGKRQPGFVGQLIVFTLQRTGMLLVPARGDDVAEAVVDLLNRLGL